MSRYQFDQFAFDSADGRLELSPVDAALTLRPQVAKLLVALLTFVEINGQNISPRDVMWLEPGTYRITVQIKAELTRPPQYRRPADAPGYNTIELEIEAGKSYQIRGRYNRDDRETPYSVILHKVEE